MPIEVLNVRAQFQNQKTQTLKILVAGPPGAGKTRMASTFPDVLYADMEGRLLSVRDRDVRAVKITSVKDLEDLRNALDQTPEIRTKMLDGPVSSVVIDTCDELARLIIRERLRSEHKETMAIADWGYLADKLRDILRGFRNLSDLNVIFNVHLRSSEDSETGRVEYRPAIQGAVGHEIAEYTDEAFLLVARPMTDARTGERRVTRHLQTYPDAQHDWVKDHSGALPLEFPIDLTTDYERLAATIFGGTPPPSATSPQGPAAAVGWEPPKKKAAAKKKAATATLDSSDGPIRATIVEEPPAPATEPDAPREQPIEPVREAVPEAGTEVAEVPEREEAAKPACEKCGTTDINENYLELSMARWGVPLCRTDFLERNRKK